MATISEAKAQYLLDQYIAAQTQATEQAIQAYAEKVKAQLAAEEEQTADKAQETTQDTSAAYDKHTVQALVARRNAMESLANRGLTRSGLAQHTKTSIARQKQVADNAAAIKGRQTLTTLQKNLEQAKRNAQAQISEHAASARKTLNQKIAEKELTLFKNVEV